jgi:hypothetical protein
MQNCAFGLVDTSADSASQKPTPEARLDFVGFRRKELSAGQFDFLNKDELHDLTGFVLSCDGQSLDIQNKSISRPPYASPERYMEQRVRAEAYSETKIFPIRSFSLGSDRDRAKPPNPCQTLPYYR